MIIIWEEMDILLLACFLMVCANMATANDLATVQSKNPSLT